MTEGWLLFDQVFDGQTLRRETGLRIKDGVVAEIGQPPPGSKRIGGLATPGFVDLQVNGGGGTLLNNDPTPDGMARIAEAHRKLGTVAILPTVITDKPEVLAAAVEAAMEMRDATGLIGLHIEGPHIAAAKRGTHSAKDIRPLDTGTLSHIKRLRAASIPVMITLAPEIVSPEQVRHLAETGTIVSIGHTDATAEQVTAAIDAGASCATHLFNAMSQMTSRAPGAVGTILHSRLPFGIICDGHHVDDRMITLALRLSGPGRAFSVSDAMATTGGPDSFRLYDKTIRVDEGRLINDEGALAGAHLSQAEGLGRLAGPLGLPLADALQMVISTPARVIGQPQLATLLGRAASDILVLGPDLKVKSTLEDSALA